MKADVIGETDSNLEMPAVNITVGLLGCRL